MKIIKAPWKDELMGLVNNSKESIKITSPFIKGNVCDELLSNKKKDTSIEIITSFKLMNIYSGSLDLSALENVINSSGTVRNYSKLHSKIYLFDDKRAIITSGNLTNGGLLSNFEYGIYTDDELVVNCIVKDFSFLSSHKDTGKIEQTHIKEVRNILSKLPESIPVKLPKFRVNESKAEDCEPLEVSDHILTSSLSGWKLEVFKCANSIPAQTFSLSEINKFEKQLQLIYPNNNNITHKIRQQLQYLRDLGLIEFLGNGQYLKLWK
jgi:phosphatidylserine/phosphatidylglycerophosphate/cardiolipin synthase-like enzyme